MASPKSKKKSFSNQPLKIFNKQIAFPSDHGSWVFLISPLLIGFFAAPRWPSEGIYLILSALSAFMIRQPILMMVKSYAGRRTRKDLPVARFWFLFYGMFGLTGLFQLSKIGHGYLLWLALPGILVFGWHLYLVRKREERHRIGVDILASGALSLAAPAAYWISVGTPDAVGWWLWGLTWFQTAASIVYAFLRLEQRALVANPSKSEKWKIGSRALIYSGFNFIAVILAGLIGWLPSWLWAAFSIQFAESIFGTLSPAIGVKPTRIGIRQLIISSIFTIVFIVVWRSS